MSCIKQDVWGEFGGLQAPFKDEYNLAISFFFFSFFFCLLSFLFLFCETLHQGDMQETHKSRTTQVYGGGSQTQERGQRT
jgi:hypothetical protein